MPNTSKMFLGANIRGGELQTNFRTHKVGLFSSAYIGIKFHFTMIFGLKGLKPFGRQKVCAALLSDGIGIRLEKRG